MHPIQTAKWVWSVSIWLQHMERECALSACWSALSTQLLTKKKEQNYFFFLLCFWSAGSNYWMNNKLLFILLKGKMCVIIVIKRIWSSVGIDICGRNKIKPGMLVQESNQCWHDGMWLDMSIFLCFNASEWFIPVLLLYRCNFVNKYMLNVVSRNSAHIGFYPFIATFNVQNV